MGRTLGTEHHKRVCQPRNAEQAALQIVDLHTPGVGLGAIHVCVAATRAARLTVDGVTQDLALNDVWVVPGWAWHSWENPHGDGCVVHSISDLSVLERLGFAREQKRAADGSVVDSGWPAPPYVRTSPIGKVP